ncbi:MAG: fluoride efflux transporter CrcB [Cryobacterium sp.]|uniref:fluoride efflux transporter CrcB n=1 Tax=unclassified Cryobacterium TaxID=2649013 RepID=UPI0018C915AC|nr:MULTISPECIES: fluoride efflux transporter CrcB [unclassified Cryobacterium]MCY7405557.1 fluoride efflux transporter CrcB [Cryobacterium sp.]MEC5154458.1 CrcB protein [Cryobacterium sp. CAN_C3]
MTPLLVLTIAVAGGVGAAARLYLDGLVRSRLGGAFPFGTTIINVSGSLLLGLVTGLALNHLLAPEWGLVLGVGLLGGYTTFSTASFETVRLAQAHRYLAALANGMGMLGASVAAAALGLWVGLALG